MTATVPAFYRGQVKRALGSLWDALPEGGVEHDPNAFLKAQTAPAPIALQV